MVVCALSHSKGVIAAKESTPRERKNCLSLGLRRLGLGLGLGFGLVLVSTHDAIGFYFLRLLFLPHWRRAITAVNTQQRPLEEYCKLPRPIIQINRMGLQILICNTHRMQRHNDGC